MNLSPTLVNGIVGPWATVGAGAAMQYATTSGGAISAYSYAAVPVGNQGTAITSPTSVTDTLGAVNYSLSGTTNGTSAAGASINTLQYTGGGLTLTTGAGGLTANGIMNVGNGTLAIQSNSLIIGANHAANYELVVSGAGNDTISSVIANNAAGASTLTMAGTGTLTLNGANTYTGGTIVDAGILSMPAGGPTGIIRGPLTINSGGTVNATANWALGFGPGTDVTAITINGGTLNFTGASNGGGTAGSSITMTGGTIGNGGTGITTFDWYNPGAVGSGDTPNLATLASSTTANVSLGINLRLNLATNNLLLNTAAGTVPSGIDLLISGNITKGDTFNEGIIKAGAGTAALSGTNSYGGRHIDQRRHAATRHRRHDGQAPHRQRPHR